MFGYERLQLTEAERTYEYYLVLQKKLQRLEIQIAMERYELLNGCEEPNWKKEA